ncbi:hypothetical protein WA026_006217 [Henosepilachna vigintioctopunctata]|uniref:Uncharacterized protein n=1 Tax=Henosepilachna vigintioctopunctata TaxID=420089 RepID=A0AAW1TPM2_9CUCU
MSSFDNIVKEYGEIFLEKKFHLDDRYQHLDIFDDEYKPEVERLKKVIECMNSFEQCNEIEDGKCQFCLTASLQELDEMEIVNELLTVMEIDKICCICKIFLIYN